MDTSKPSANNLRYLDFSRKAEKKARSDSAKCGRPCDMLCDSLRRERLRSQKTQLAEFAIGISKVAEMPATALLSETQIEGVKSMLNYDPRSEEREPGFLRFVHNYEMCDRGLSLTKMAETLSKGDASFSEAIALFFSTVSRRSNCPHVTFYQLANFLYSLSRQLDKNTDINKLATLSDPRLFDSVNSMMPNGGLHTGWLTISEGEERYLTTRIYAVANTMPENGVYYGRCNPSVVYEETWIS